MGGAPEGQPGKNNWRLMGVMLLLILLFSAWLIVVFYFFWSWLNGSAPI